MRLSVCMGIIACLASALVLTDSTSILRYDYRGNRDAATMERNSNALNLRAAAKRRNKIKWVSGEKSATEISMRSWREKLNKGALDEKDAYWLKRAVDDAEDLLERCKKLEKDCDNIARELQWVKSLMLKQNRSAKLAAHHAKYDVRVRSLEKNEGLKWQCCSCSKGGSSDSCRRAILAEDAMWANPMAWGNVIATGGNVALDEAREIEAVQTCEEYCGSILRGGNWEKLEVEDMPSGQTSCGPAHLCSRTASWEVNYAKLVDSKKVFLKD